MSIIQFWGTWRVFTDSYLRNTKVKTAEFESISTKNPYTEMFNPYFQSLNEALSMTFSLYMVQKFEVSMILYFLRIRK